MKMMECSKYYSFGDNAGVYKSCGKNISEIEDTLNTDLDGLSTWIYRNILKSKKNQTIVTILGSSEKNLNWILISK